MINTIVFDYGGVLAYPVSGNWFIPYNFFKILGFGNSIKIIFRRGKLNQGFIKGNEYLTANHLLFTEEEEYEQFMAFYRIVFSEMKMKISDSVREKLAKDAVYNDNRVRFYDDVIDGIKNLKTGYRVMIISDTWPSLRRVLKNNGVLDLLDGLVMSCSHNKTKETVDLFNIAVRELNLNPAECLFVDDSPSNLKNAASAGFHPVLMCRRTEAQTDEYPVIRGLDDLEAVIGSLNED